MQLSSNLENKNDLNDNWNIWLHYCYDNNWELESYKKICTLDCVEDIIVFFNGNKGLSTDIFFISFETGDSITCSTKLGRIIIEY